MTEQGAVRKANVAHHLDERPIPATITPDRVRYSQKHVSYAGPHSYRGVQVVRLSGFGGSKTIRAERPAGDTYSMLVLTRGSGEKMEAEFGGKNYYASGNLDLRASFLPEQAEACLEFNPGSRGITIRFPPGLLKQYLEQSTGTDFAPLLFDRNPALIGLATMLDLSVVRPDPAQDIITDQVMRSIALILSGVDLNGLATTSNRIALPPAKVRRVIDFIEANLHARLSLDTLAELVSLSPFHFARAFKETAGVSPYRYVCDRRLLKAQRLLLAGQEPLGKVAQACGFGSPSHFSAAFTRARQISPREYRSQFGFGGGNRAIPA